MKPRQLIVLWLLAAVGVGVLALAVHGAPPWSQDVAIAQELQERRPIDRVISPVMIAVSWAGYSPVSEAFVALAITGAALIAGWREALFIGSTLLADGLTVLIKTLTARPRPLPGLVTVHQLLRDGSFPSGHVVH